MKTKERNSGNSARSGSKEKLNVNLCHLEELRKERGLTQKQLADALHFQSSTISNYENNQHAPSLETLVVISRYFNVSIDYLLGETDIRERVDKSLDIPYFGDVTLRDMVWMLMKIVPALRKGVYTIVRSLMEMSKLPSESMETKEKLTEKRKTK